MEENKKDQLEEKKFQEQKEEVQKEFEGFFQSLKEYLPLLLNIKKDTDKEATAQTIRDGVSIKGQTAWILVFSILIASIGLNVSSTAVVIGAMLISPLMGPILGVGFSIGVNDVDTLKASVINFGAMVFLSLLTSFLFFSIPIFKEATPEILARTKPDVRDVLIAVSGGLALFIAISRNKPQFNTVAGVAIATALMPPLCTAGFGLATGHFNYFGRAMFLFMINSIYIALAAFVITKYLKFPMRKYINQAKRKRISRIASLIAFVILALSIFLFYELYLINDYKIRAEKFIQNLKDNGVNIIGDSKESIDYEKKEIKLIVWSKVSSNDRERWAAQMEAQGIKNTTLTIADNQDEFTSIKEQLDKIKDVYVEKDELRNTILEKESVINELEKELSRYNSSTINFDQMIKEIHINYADLEEIRFSREYASDFEKMDTLNFIAVKWKQKVSKRKQKDEEEKLQEWLKTRLGLKSIHIRQLK